MHFKITEKPDASLGRTGYIITSGGGITEAAFYGEHYQALVRRVCDELNGVKATAVDAGGCAPPAQVVEPLAEQPRPMDTAPRDGTMVRLLVRFDANSTEDTDGAAWTIGANSYEASGDDLWQFAGWCWTHDHFTEGKGTPIGWLPLVDGKGVAP